MIEVIKEADVDKNGTTSKSEFMQIMRRIANEREVNESEKDWQMLRKSKYSPAEIEETKQMYKEGDVMTGQKYSLTSLRNMFDALGQKISREDFQVVREMFSDCDYFRSQQVIFFPEFR